jgi:hypothetical protein
VGLADLLLAPAGLDGRLVDAGDGSDALGVQLVGERPAALLAVLGAGAVAGDVLSLAVDAGGVVLLDLGLHHRGRRGLR